MVPDLHRLRVLLLYAASPEARALSYQVGWPKHFRRHPRFECLPVNVRSRWARVPRRPFDAVVILHSAFSNGQYLTGRLLEQVAALPQPKAYFVGNEYKLMPAKVAFCEQLRVALVVSQLSDPRAHDLYRERLGCAVAAIPSGGLDTEVFAPRTPPEERRWDLGYRALPTAFYLGHDERNQLAVHFAEAAARLGLSASLSLELADRLGTPAAWAAFLDDCRGQLGFEAGADFFELTDETRDLVGGWGRAQQQEPSPEEVFARFFSEPRAGPSGRALSGRIVEAAGTKTVQLLLEGEYGGYFRPDEHYIPVRKDFANVDEALAKLADRAYSARVAEQAYDVAVADLTYEKLIDRFYDALAAVL